MGALLSTVQILSLDYPIPSLTEAVILAAAFVGGGLWATLLTMVIWRIYRSCPPAAPSPKLTASCRTLSVTSRPAARRPSATPTGKPTRAPTAERSARRSRRRGPPSWSRCAPAEPPAIARPSPSSAGNPEQIFGGLTALSDLLKRGATAYRSERTAYYAGCGRCCCSSGAADHRRPGRPSDRPCHQRDRRRRAKPAPTPPCRLLSTNHRAAEDRYTLAVPANLATEVDASEPTRCDRGSSARACQSELAVPALRHALRTAVTAAALAFTMSWFNPYEHR